MPDDPTITKEARKLASADKECELVEFSRKCAVDLASRRFDHATRPVPCQTR